MLACLFSTGLGLGVAAAAAQAVWVGPGESGPSRNALALIGVAALATLTVGLVVRLSGARARVFLATALVLSTVLLAVGTTAALMVVRWGDAGAEVPVAVLGILLTGLGLAVVLVRRNPRPDEDEPFPVWGVLLSLLVAVGALTPWPAVQRALLPAGARHDLAVARFGPSYLGALRTVEACPAVLEHAAPSRVVVSPYRGRAYRRRDGEGGTYRFRLEGRAFGSATVAIVAQDRPEPEGGVRFVSRNGHPAVGVELRAGPWSAPTRVRCPVAPPLAPGAGVRP